MPISCKIKSEVFILVKISFIEEINYQNFARNNRLLVQTLMTLKASKKK